MRNLDLPVIDALSNEDPVDEDPVVANNYILWENIVKKKNREPRKKLDAIKDTIKARYKLYSKHSKDLAQIVPSTDKALVENKDGLISCYGNNVTFSPVKKRLRKSSYRCPYCCINRPNTLDHYFDKDDYPEYSVFVPNLLPCCDTCNNIKRTLVFDENGHRVFLHYYYDQLPRYQFVYIRFSIDTDGIPLIRAELKFEEDSELTELIKRHFAKLNLLEKYKEAAEERLPIIHTELIAHKSSMNMHEIRELLTVRYNSLVVNVGINYWEACIYEGILNSTDFLESYTTNKYFP